MKTMLYRGWPCKCRTCVVAIFKTNSLRCPSHVPLINFAAASVNCIFSAIFLAYCMYLNVERNYFLVSAHCFANLLFTDDTLRERRVNKLRLLILRLARPSKTVISSLGRNRRYLSDQRSAMGIRANYPAPMKIRYRISASTSN